MLPAVWPGITKIDDSLLPGDKFGVVIVTKWVASTAVPNVTEVISGAASAEPVVPKIVAKMILEKRKCLILILISFAFEPFAFL